MPKSHKHKRVKRRQLVDPQTFVQCLAHEIERYCRYQRSFALLLVQAPTVGSRSDRLSTTRKAAEATRHLTRGCDFVTSFENSGLVVTLLPETGPEGARVVFERVASHIEEPGASCTLKLATYPEHAEIIDYFLGRVQELLKGDPAESWATATDRRLWQAPVPSSAGDALPPRRKIQRSGSRSRRGRRGAA